MNKTISSFKAKLLLPVKVFQASNLFEVYQSVGAETKTESQQRLTTILENASPPAITTWRELIRQSLAQTRHYAAAPELLPAIREEIKRYLGCLTAWATGSGLTAYTHPKLLPPEDWQPLELAYLLQTEPGGCQTGAYRVNQQGDFIFWHAEEEEGAFNNRLVQLEYLDQKQNWLKMTCFLYPSLLPGNSFGWVNDRFFYATDSLNLSCSNPQPKIFTATLMGWLFYHLYWLEPASIVAALKPFFDGFCFWKIDSAQNQIQKIEFGGNFWKVKKLGWRECDFLYQCNLLENPALLGSETYEVQTAAYPYFQERQRFNTQYLTEIETEPTLAIRRLLQVKNLIPPQNGWGYVNQDMKAVLFLVKEGQQLNLLVNDGFFI